MRISAFSNGIRVPFSRWEKKKTKGADAFDDTERQLWGEVGRGSREGPRRSAMGGRLGGEASLWDKKGLGGRSVQCPSVRRTFSGVG